MKEKVTISLTQQQIANIRMLAKKTGLGFSELVRRAVDDYFQKPFANLEANKEQK